MLGLIASHFLAAVVKMPAQHLRSADFGIREGTPQTFSPNVQQAGNVIDLLEPPVGIIGDFGLCEPYSDLNNTRFGDTGAADLDLPTELDRGLVRRPFTKDVDFPTLSSIIDSRLKNGFEPMKAEPRKMVMENQTMWSHPLLYEVEMPKAMQGA